MPLLLTASGKKFADPFVILFVPILFLRRSLLRGSGQSVVVVGEGPLRFSSRFDVKSDERFEGEDRAYGPDTRVRERMVARDPHATAGASLLYAEIEIARSATESSERRNKAFLVLQRLQE